jgi:hypothetical protein
MKVMIWITFKILLLIVIPADSDSDMDQPPKCVKWHSKTPYNGEEKGKPTQMQFFLPHWKDILEMAKKEK